MNLSKFVHDLRGVRFAVASVAAVGLLVALPFSAACREDCSQNQPRTL